MKIFPLKRQKRKMKENATPKSLYEEHLGNNFYRIHGKIVDKSILRRPWTNRLQKEYE